MKSTVRVPDKFAPLFDEAQKYVARYFAEHMSRMIRWGFVNGLPGFVTMEHGGTLQTTALAIEDGKVVAIYVMRNPDKLQHLGGESLH